MSHSCFFFTGSESCRSTVSSSSTSSTRTQRDTDFNDGTSSVHRWPFSSGDRNSSNQSEGGVFTLDVPSSLLPPPYTADKPPAYTDIYPS